MVAARLPPVRFCSPHIFKHVRRHLYSDGVLARLVVERGREDHVAIVDILVSLCTVRVLLGSFHRMELQPPKC